MIAEKRKLFLSFGFQGHGKQRFTRTETCMPSNFATWANHAHHCSYLPDAHTDCCCKEVQAVWFACRTD